MSMSILKNQIKNNSPDHLYLFYGKEEYLKKYYIDEIRNCIIPKGTEDFNLTIIEDKNDVKNIPMICQSLPVFSEKKLVVIKNSDIFKNQYSNEDLEYLIKDIPDYICIVFFEEAVDKRLRLYKLLQKHGTVVEFPYQKAASLARWVIKGFGLSGKKIEYDSALLLVEYCEPGMTEIFNEIEKIVSYLGDKDRVTVDVIETVCTRTLKSRIFDLTDAVASRNAKKAFSLLNDMINAKEPIPRISYMIVRQLKQVLEMKYMLNDGIDKKDASRLLGVPGFVADKLMKQAMGFSIDSIRKVIKACLEADEEVKSGRMNDRLALELLLGSIIID